MYKVVILPPAKLDIIEAASWYDSKQKGLGKRFTKEVRSKVLFIHELLQFAMMIHDVPF